MKKITYLKPFSFLIALLCVVSFGFGQRKIAELTFETAGGYSTSIPEFTDYVPPAGGRDYFIRTDGSTIRGNTAGINFTNIQGSYYFAAQDIDGEGAVLPVFLNIDDINISGYTSIEFRVYLAEDDQVTNGGTRTQHWDNADYVHFNYDIDNTATFSPLLWVENDGGGFNREPQLDNDFDGDGDGTPITSAFTQFTRSISGTGSLLDIEIIFDLDSGDEDIAIDNIEIWGTLIPCATTVTWDGTNWSAPPDITTEAILNASYDTATDGGFSACSLTISNGTTLNIADNDSIEVENDLVVDAGGIITVQPYAAFIQNNDIGLLTNNGTISVAKDTAPLNNWYEYTYWSSPVSNATVGVALSDSDAGRRYIFNASQFNDEFAEVGNNNATVLGQDDIDDEGDDWQWVNGATMMQSGIGYAATHSEAAFIVPPGPFTPPQFRYTFTGTFNNGVINVNVDRNDTTIADNNWNLIGNPYPSAIEIDAFMTQNMYDATTNPSGTLEGAIYFWSQNTNYALNANGNEALNFDTTDYAIYNGMGPTMGGDGLTPNGFIPSGQGFFVSFSDSSPTNSGTVVFNNAMRSLSLSPDNSQFFRNSNSKKKSTSSANKLWVNLTSDNGVFNQILLGYAEGATNNDDGAYYDARKIVAPKAFAALYSTIENTDKKFAIQGKATNSLNEEEIISLGFSTNIDVATLYKLSLAQIEGEFLTSNTVYLKDYLLNTLHNLSASDYTFTSEVGEFNERFEIVFNANALSIEDISTNANTLKIVELEDDRVQFTTSSSIKTVRIFDLLGRQLYAFKGQKNSETYTLSNLSSTIYIAKVELSNGATITKKAFKK